MRCKHCGAVNPRGSAFCAQCGAPLPESGSGLKKIEDKVFILFSVIALLLVMVPVFSGRSAAVTAEKLITSFAKGDGKALIKLFPEELLKAEAKDSGISLKEQKELLVDMIEPVKIPGVKISSSAQHDVAYGDEERKYIIEEYKEDGIKVKDAKEMAVKVTVSALGQKAGGTLNIPVIQVGRDWYVDSYRLGEMDYDDLDSFATELIDDLFSL